MSVGLSKNMAWGGLFVKMLLKNHFLRLWQDKRILFLYAFLTAGSIIVAVMISSQSAKFANVAVIDDKRLPVLNDQDVDIHYLDHMPLQTDLVTQKYDAFIEMKDQLIVHTYKNEDFKKQLLFLLTTNHEPFMQMAHQGETIFGFMIMFVMMQALFYTTLYGEDKESHMLERIHISGCSLLKYLLSQSIITIVLSWSSTFSILVILHISGFNIGFSLYEYAFLLSLLTLFSTAFAILMNSLFDKETTSLSASAIIVLSSLLSGTFYSFIKDDGIIGLCINVLPQKVLLDLSKHLTHFQQSQWMGLVYLSSLIFIFYSIAIVKERKSMSHH